MFTTKCPRADELQTYVNEGQAEERIKRHIASCEICFGIVAEMVKQADLINTVRQAVRAIDDKTRARAAAICARNKESSPPPATSE